MLRQLHRRHEIHYVAFEDPEQPEGVARAGEYSTKAYPFRHRAVDKRSPKFALELAAGLFGSLPVSLSRYYSPAMADLLRLNLLRRNFDRVVCDFLSPAPHFPSLRRGVLFQHNVETVIWRRRAEQASGVSALYLRLQAERMFAYERKICQEAGFVLAVSEQDARTMQDLFGIKRLATVPTGVDIDYFTPRESPPRQTDLVFVGSMDWAPNVDGIQFFVERVLPLIRRRKPGCSLVVAGRSPSNEMLALAREDPRIQMTGTVPDVRPYLWSSAVSIVPLRVGGGTRLKIYEAMAARTPVVSTTVGAEGLPVRHGEHLLLADEPQAFADACLTLLEDEDRRGALTERAWRFVSDSFSWDRVAREFEALLEQAPQWEPLG